METKEKELEQREKMLAEREQKLEQRERKMGAFSQAVKNRKESWYDHMHVSVKTMDWVIGIVSGLLVIVIILIILEATGVFKL